MIKKTFKYAFLLCACIILFSSALQVQAFTDVRYDNWASKSIRNLTDIGILTGYNYVDFKPTNNISREELATVLVKSLQVKNNIDSSAFSFISTSFEDVEQD